MTTAGSAGSARSDAWVLAVDVRGPRLCLATAGAGGVRGDAGDHGDAALEQAGLDHAGRPPLAVVVVHPAGWSDARVAAALEDVTARAPGDGWPRPVPLTVPEAAAWRALEFGLVPERGRLAVLDPAVGEASVVDRHEDALAAVGPVVSLEPGAAGAEEPQALASRLVALAGRALDVAPAGPPFAGILLAGTLPDTDGAELPAAVARATGRAPLVPGDPARVAVLGAAALGWAAATAPTDVPASPSASPSASPCASPSREAGRVATRAAPPSPGSARPVAGARAPRARPRLWAAAVLAVLVVVAVVAGLGWHRARTAPSPYTYTCPDGSVVAYSYECASLAPSPPP